MTRAREYGATLAIAVGLMLPAVAQAEDSNPKCPSIADVAGVLRDTTGQVAIASWVNLDGTKMQLFSDPAGHLATLVLIAGDCAIPVQQGAMLRTWAIVGGEEA